MNIKTALLGIFLTLIPFFGFSETNSNEILRVVVLDAQNNDPIPYASIFLPDNGYKTRAYAKGMFILM